MKTVWYFDLPGSIGTSTDARTNDSILEVIEDADRLGAHSVWFFEHHDFQDDYLTRTLTFASDVAAPTRQVRIGNATTLTTLRHPRHIVEETAVVDLNSGGRVELGLGAAYAHDEFEMLGKDAATRYRDVETTALKFGVELDRLWTETIVPRPIEAACPLCMGFQGARRTEWMDKSLLSANAALWPEYRCYFKVETPEDIAREDDEQ